jgi:hypothetical protein
MTALLTTTFVGLLFFLVRSADLAITAGRSNDVLRAILYGIIAVLAIVVAVLLVVR